MFALTDTDLSKRILGSADGPASFNAEATQRGARVVSCDPMQAMDVFLADYDAGKAEGRYLAAELPSLPCDDRSFDLALCSHFLFLYSEQLGLAFHRAAIQELCRVSKEVRIFPLLALGGVVLRTSRESMIHTATPSHRLDRARPVRVSARHQ